MQRRRSGRLADLARRRGILPTYVDAAGHRRVVPERTLRRLLRAFDDATALPRRISLETGPRGRVSREPPPSVVILRERGRPVVLPGPLTQAVAISAAQMRLDGARHWRRLAVDPSGRPRLPLRLPVGRHTVRLRRGNERRTIHVVVAPRRLPVRRGPRRWGVFAPVYALRDARTWGCGDLRSLEAVGRWAASYGASVLSTLPLLPAFLDRPFDPSPYRPVSQLFWNEIYLDPTRTPEFRRSTPLRRWVRGTEFRQRVARLERKPFVDFRGVARLKREVLERMLGEFNRGPAHRRRAFHRFAAQAGPLRAYARFRASLEGSGRRGERYHAFAQWLVDEQLRQVARRLRLRGITLALDLPLGTHPRGFDRQRDALLYARGVHVGSPPDPGVPRGQDWEFAPWVPERSRSEGHRAFGQALRHQFSVAGIVRIDHVLGLHRLFWIPTGSPPRTGTYVRSPARELYAVVLAEARRARAMVVGEDLGTVPPEVRPALARHGLLSLYVAELEWDRPRSARPIPLHSVVSLNTHDHLPFAGYWAERCARYPHSADHGRFPGARAPNDLAFHIATTRLARSRAELFLVNVEDLWGETRPQNVPGHRGPNFSRRFRRNLVDLFRDVRSAELLSTIDGLRRGRRRRWYTPIAERGRGVRVPDGSR